jgi:hypothetical protein
MYSKPSLIQINWGERSSGLVKQKLALKGKFNDIGSADGEKSP